MLLIWFLCTKSPTKWAWSSQRLLCTTASTLLRQRTSSTIVRWLRRTLKIWSTNCSAATARKSAYFNHGLINYIYGQKRLLPCDMSFDTFFIDPYGDVMPCNGTKDKEVMGNLNNQTWDELWNSPEAEKVRAKVRCCDRDCWMIGSVSPAMHKYIWKPATWVLVHKFKALFTKHPYSMYELKICRDYRDGKVTKEDLDKCSTCDMNCVINNGLSEASKEQLKHKTGEEIVDADIAQQMETK